MSTVQSTLLVINPNSTQVVTDYSSLALEPFRATGLHSAMMLLPILVAALAAVLFAASRTVTAEVNSLRAWMSDSANAQR